MRIAVYPGTFDPIHYGHIDIALRAARIFDRLIVGVYDRPQKSLFFSTEERVAMATQALEDVPNVVVMSYSGLTVSFVQSVGARIIVRGLRAMFDFELEYQTAMINRQLAHDVDMICLMTSLDYAFVSSTMVKEIAAAEGPLDQFVPREVSEALAARVAMRERTRG